MKWREASGALCDKRISVRLKPKFYRSIVRPTNMLYGSECWVVDEKIKPNMRVAEMRMLRWMSRVKGEDRIRNEYVSGSICVESRVNSMRENRLR